MIVKQLWEKLDPQQKQQIYGFLTSDLWTQFADLHFQLFGHQLITIDPKLPPNELKIEYAIARAKFDFWNELRNFVQTLNPQEF